MTLPKKNRIARTANVLAISVATVVTLLLPIGYFVVLYEHSIGSLEAEALINSRIISGIINDNPEYWRFEQMRLEEVLKRRPIDGNAETRRVVDLENRVIAEHIDSLRSPLIKRTYDLKDAGVTVARIEISRSLLPLLAHAGIMGFFSLLTGLSIYYLIRILPFRALIQAEGALRKSEERYRTILQTALDGVWRLDTQGRLVEVNSAYCRMSGYSEQELLAMNVLAIECGETTAAIAARLQKVITAGSDRFEARHRHKDGHTFEVEISVQYRPVEGGELVAFLRDISKRKRAEEAHKKLQAQLVQVQKMESVGRLAGGVAHDFNNMLGVILGYTEIILMEMSPEEPLHEVIMEIRKAAERSADLTGQLLAFARKQTVIPRVLDLNENVAGMLKMLQRLIGEDIKLDWQPGENLYPLKMDPGQIDQILVNLCVNARDAISGIGKIIIKTEQAHLDAGYSADHPGSLPGDYVSIVVSDNGCGMDEEAQARVFEPFFTTKEMGKGTGLGMATVYGIVKQNNGSIEVSSKAGQGTTFKICLPRYVGENGHCRAESMAAPAGYHQETVLLVEDEAAILNMGKMMLESLGYRVLAANSAAEALRLAEKHGAAIDLLITDVIMPEMNGRDLAKTLQSLYPNLSCLFMSGYAAEIIAEHGVLDEKVHFIPKPFAMNDLAVKVRQALAGRA